MTSAPATWRLDTMPDVEVCSLFQGGKIDLPEHKLRKGYDVVTALYPIAMDMEFNGIPVSLAKLREVEAEAVPKFTAGLAELRQMAKRDDFNIDSAKQVAWFLYDPTGPCKLICPAKTKDGAPSTSKDTLAKLGHHVGVQVLLKTRKVRDVLRRYVYGKGLIIREDGRIHPSWNTTGTVTWRWSSSPNFQNWPDYLRSIVEAPPGWVIVGADQAQLEMRIIAVLSGSKDLIERLERADESKKLDPYWDPHAYVAASFFTTAFTELDESDPIQKLKKNALRTIAKTCFYALGYGSGAQTMLEGILKKGYDGPSLTIQIVKGVVTAIFKLWPEIQDYQKRAIKLADQEECVRSLLLNRWRGFPLAGKLGVEATIAGNHPIQATAADLVDLRTLYYWPRMKALCPEAWMFAQVHDALYSMCPESRASELAALKEESMSCMLSLVPGAPAMRFLGKAKIGKNWRDVS